MRKPAPDTQAAIRATEARLVVMRQALADREATIVAAQQQFSVDNAEEVQI
jgi:hypothetical protein